MKDVAQKLSPVVKNGCWLNILKTIQFFPFVGYEKLMKKIVFVALFEELTILALLGHLCKIYLKIYKNNYFEYLNAYKFFARVNLQKVLKRLKINILKNPIGCRGTYTTLLQSDTLVKIGSGSLEVFKNMIRIMIY